MRQHLMPPAVLPAQPPKNMSPIEDRAGRQDRPLRLKSAVEKPEVETTDATWKPGVPHGVARRCRTAGRRFQKIKSHAPATNGAEEEAQLVALERLLEPGGSGREGNRRRSSAEHEEHEDR